MLKNIIRELIDRSTRRVRPNGAVEYSYYGFIGNQMKEDIQTLFREGKLNQYRDWFCAAADDCHVSFRFGVGASTCYYVWFSYVDERPLRKLEAVESV